MNFVDLISFLRDFYGIANSSLKFNKLKHDDIKTLFPFIKRCPLDKVYLDDLSRGNTIGVYDKNNNIVYYYNPHLLEINNDFYEENNIEERKKIEVDINNLSKDELLKIRSKLRKEGEIEEAYNVTKRIRKLKENEPKEYYKRKEKMLIKESYND